MANRTRIDALASLLLLAGCGGTGEGARDAGRPGVPWRIEIRAPGVSAGELDERVAAPVVRTLGGDAVAVSQEGSVSVTGRATRRADAARAVRAGNLPRSALAPFLSPIGTRAGPWVRVQMDAPGLFGAGVALEDVRRAIAAGGGELDAGELARLEVRTGSGRHLGDVAKVAPAPRSDPRLPPGPILRLRGRDGAALDRALEAIEERLGAGGEARVLLRCPRVEPVVDVMVDREQAQLRGVDPRSVPGAVRAGMGLRETIPGRVSTELRVTPYDVDDPGAIPVHGTDGAAVPAGDVSDIAIGTGYAPLLRGGEGLVGYLAIEGVERNVLVDLLVAPGPELAGAGVLWARDAGEGERTLIRECARTMAEQR